MQLPRPIRNEVRLFRGVVSVLSLLVHLDLYLMGVVTNLSQTGSQSQSCRYPASITSHSSIGTEALLKSSSEIILWHLNNYAAERKCRYGKLMPRYGFVG